ncbi:hypothetical protein B0H14DRAFT_2615332 [Mycena olivaceomarginata]|nr:hypothetical protein B0H14DRAFT_2615332 [Mycena olivaceomarginata]
MTGSDKGPMWAYFYELPTVNQKHLRACCRACVKHTLKNPDDDDPDAGAIEIDDDELAVDVGSDNEQSMCLLGCHKVAVPQLNEYKVPILPEVQCGVPVPPALFCRKPFFLPPGIQTVSRVFCLKISSRASNTIHVPSIQSSRMFPTSHQAPVEMYSRQLAQVGHASHIPQISMCSVLGLAWSRLFTGWVSRDHLFGGVTSYIS